MVTKHTGKDMRLVPKFSKIISLKLLEKDELGSFSEWEKKKWAFLVK